MPNTLVIVESPAKARTIEKYLGKGYTVESSIGHIRDLPRSAAEIPEKYKNEAWARLGLNVEDDFKALYVVSADKKGHVAKLKKLAAAAAKITHILLSGQKFTSATSIDNKFAKIPSIIIPVVTVTKDNIKQTVIADGFATKSDLCNGIPASACAGL